MSGRRKAGVKQEVVEEPAEDYVYVMEDVPWEVERIVNARCRDDGKFEFLVKWKGYGEDQNTWEPLPNLLGDGDDDDEGCRHLLGEFFIIQRIKKKLADLFDDNASEIVLVRTLTYAKDDCVLPPSILTNPVYKSEVSEIMSRLNRVITDNIMPCLQEAARNLALRYVRREPKLAVLVPDAGFLPEGLSRTVKTSTDSSWDPWTGKRCRVSEPLPQVHEGMSVAHSSKRRRVPAMHTEHLSDSFVDLADMIKDILAQDDIVLNKLMLERRLHYFALNAVTGLSIRERLEGNCHMYSAGAKSSIIWSIINCVKKYMMSSLKPRWLLPEELVARAGIKGGTKALEEVVRDPSLENKFVQFVESEIGVRSHYILRRLQSFHLPGALNRELPGQTENEWVFAAWKTQKPRYIGATGPRKSSRLGTRLEAEGGDKGKDVAVSQSSDSSVTTYLSDEHSHDVETSSSSPGLDAVSSAKPRSPVLRPESKTDVVDLVDEVEGTGAVGEDLAPPKKAILYGGTEAESAVKKEGRVKKEDEGVVPEPYISGSRSASGAGTTSSLPTSRSAGERERKGRRGGRSHSRSKSRGRPAPRPSGEVMGSVEASSAVTPQPPSPDPSGGKAAEIEKSEELGEKLTEEEDDGQEYVWLFNSLYSDELTCLLRRFKSLHPPSLRQSRVHAKAQAKQASGKGTGEEKGEEGGAGGGTKRVDGAKLLADGIVKSGYMVMTTSIQHSMAKVVDQEHLVRILRSSDGLRAGVHLRDLLLALRLDGHGQVVQLEGDETIIIETYDLLNPATAVASPALPISVTLSALATASVSEVPHPPPVVSPVHSGKGEAAAEEAAVPKREVRERHVFLTLRGLKTLLSSLVRAQMLDGRRGDSVYGILNVVLAPSAPAQLW